MPAAPSSCPGRQVVHRDAAGPHRRRIGLDPDGGLGAENIDPRHARKDADPLADLGAAIVVQLPRSDGIAGEGDIKDRLVVRIGLREGRRRGEIDRQAPGGLGDRRLHVGGGGIDALGQGELQRQAGLTLGALGSHELEPVDLHELPLERGGDVARHRLGARARVADLHLDHRVVDRRKVVHRQLKVGQGAEQDHGRGEDRRHHRTPDERLGEIHDRPLSPAGTALSAARGDSGAFATRTFPPGVTAI